MFGWGMLAIYRNSVWDIGIDFWDFEYVLSFILLRGQATDSHSLTERAMHNLHFQFVVFDE